VTDAPAPVRFSDCDSCIDAVLSRTGKRIVLGIPLGIGKPNVLVNALYARAKRDPSLKLDIITALSLNPPRGASALEERFLRPIRERVWPGYPRLLYADDREAEQIPDNVRVYEFYMRSGSLLKNSYAQRHYISSNYTHVARDMLDRGVNLLMQAVALDTRSGKPRYSLSSNPDVTLQLLPALAERALPCVKVVQVNRALPWFGGAAELPESAIDLLLDDADLDHEPFSVPHEPVDTAAWAIGLHASVLVKDGGTLQVGIGALGDAVCHALKLRDKQNQSYRALLNKLAVARSSVAVGGDEPFWAGLYVASELISNPLFSLFEAGIVRRRVYEDSDGKSPKERAGEKTEVNGTCMQGAFFLGPSDFYQRLRGLDDVQRALIDMTSVGEVNRVYTHYELERMQRRHARFVNVCMKATLLGSAVSDQLEGGAVVSGVGGQNEFVMMAHQLLEGRSALLLRSTYEKEGQVRSNIHWEYSHSTIARHMRDIFVTEYGVADLRGKSDQECVEAMLGVADSRFQELLCREAKRGKKLPSDYRIPESRRANLPERLAAELGPAQAQGLLPKLPFGSDLSEEELRLAGRLARLNAAISNWEGRGKLLAAATKRTGANGASEELRFALAHLGLERPQGTEERLLARLVRAAHAL
jgi:acyl-CoA hydrolase